MDLKVSFHSNLGLTLRYRAGTLNALVMRLTNSNFNYELLAAFLAGYSTFSTPTQFWETLLERYNVPREAEEASQSQFVRMRVANIVLQWIKLVRIASFGEAISHD